MKKQYLLGVLSADDEELRPLRAMGVRVTTTNGSQDNTQIVTRLTDQQADEARRLACVLQVAPLVVKDIGEFVRDIYGEAGGLQRCIKPDGKDDVALDKMYLEYPHGQAVTLADNSVYWVWSTLQN